MPEINYVPNLGRLQFNQAAPQGFGDRFNSWPWSMLWWQGKLYVGTNRAWQCAEFAGMNRAFPLFIKYPPRDPDAGCTAEASDLPLRAEIWCWTPETDEWERVYQSPQDVPLRKPAGKYMTREVGYRYMSSFVEADGTEALYVSGVNSRFIFRPVPPPRLLRSTDGRTFEPVPQDKGTFLGELDVCSFRTITTYKGRFFITAGNIQGDGVVLESSNPAAGNDSFQQITPPGMTVFQMYPFNGYLYLGVRDVKRGYQIVKTDASGSPPYTFTPVVMNGAYLPEPSRGVVSMHVFQNRLYIGTDRPATEVIRINPNDSWELVIGKPRETPDGWKYPLSALDAGFNTWLNGHIWRMQEYNGRLYIGTWNMATEFRNVDGADEVLKPNYGFDLFESADGQHFAPVSTSGFGDKFSYGVRTFADTPHGLFIGAANKWYGLQIWRGTSADLPQNGVSNERWAQASSATSSSAISSSVTPEQTSTDAQMVLQDATGQSLFSQLSPEQLVVEASTEQFVLSWKTVPDAAQYRVWRAPVLDQRHMIQKSPILARMQKIMRSIISFMPNIYLPPIPQNVWIPGAFTEIGTTELSYFVDTNSAADEHYLYYVQADSLTGECSAASNWVSVPILTPAVTFDTLMGVVDYFETEEKLESANIANLIRSEIDQARTFVERDDLTSAENQLQSLCHNLNIEHTLQAEQNILVDFQIQLAKLVRRIALVGHGIIEPDSL